VVAHVCVCVCVCDVCVYDVCVCIGAQRSDSEVVAHVRLSRGTSRDNTSSQTCRLCHCRRRPPAAPAHEFRASNRCV
jgi:hypothetical protein